MAEPAIWLPDGQSSVDDVDLKLLDYGTMKNEFKYSLKLAPLFFAAAALTACDVQKTEEGEMPEVKVEGEAKLPKYDVDAPEVTTGTKTVEVPTIEVKPAEEREDLVE